MAVGGTTTAHQHAQCDSWEHFSPARYPHELNSRYIPVVVSFRLEHIVLVQSSGIRHPLKASLLCARPDGRRYSVVDVLLNCLTAPSSMTAVLSSVDSSPILDLKSRIIGFVDGI